MTAFDKNNDDTLDFVTAAANLQSAVYGIDSETREKSKACLYCIFVPKKGNNCVFPQMGGKIIPAIAMIDSGLIILQALQLLHKSYNVHLQFKPAVPLSMCPLNLKCSFCQDMYMMVLCDPARCTLADIVNGILGDSGG